MGYDEREARWHIHMYCKRHAVQVMAHGYPTSQARICMECWGNCWGRVSGQSTLLVKRPVQPRSAAPNVRHRASTILKRTSGYPTGKSCEHSHVVKAGPVQSLHAVVCSCLQTRLKQATSYSNTSGDITNTRCGLDMRTRPEHEGDCRSYSETAGGH